MAIRMELNPKPLPALKRHFGFVAATVTLALFLLLFLSGTAYAATYTVNSTADAVPPVAGTLRWAIQRANTNPGLV